MPVWNGELYLRQAIDSILAQTEQNHEFLIIDDGSTDDTVAIIESYQDPRIRLFQQEHAGIVMALNRGVAESRAEWIARMDSDDIAHPDRLRRQWNYLTQRPDAILCHTQIKLIGETDYFTKVPRLVRSDALLRLKLCYECPIVHPTTMFRKDAFLDAGGYMEDERHAEDFALWGRLAAYGKMIALNEPLLSYRVHGGSISRQQAEMQISLSQTISKRHCRIFMSLGEEEAERAINALRAGHAGAKLSDWLWLVTRCFPKMEKQSFEMWLWVAKSTIRRMIRSISYVD